MAAGRINQIADALMEELIAREAASGHKTRSRPGAARTPSLQHAAAADTARRGNTRLRAAA